MPSKGSQKANHKYVSRKWKNGHWEYYYGPSKVSQYQSEVNSLKNEIAALDKKAKLTDTSARGYASKAKSASGNKTKGPRGFNVGSAASGTNNKYVQEIELIPEAENYRGIYKLHKSWTQYKIAQKMPILQQDTSLSETENYNKC